MKTKYVYWNVNKAAPRKEIYSSVSRREKEKSSTKENSRSEIYVNGKSMQLGAARNFPDEVLCEKLYKQKWKWKHSWKLREVILKILEKSLAFFFFFFHSRFINSTRKINHETRSITNWRFEKWLMYFLQINTTSDAVVSGRKNVTDTSSGKNR